MPKKRSDSAHTMTEIAASAIKLKQPPLPLEEKELQFWNAIIEARHTWNNIDMMHACNLARTMCSIEENTKLLKEEGDVVWNTRGTQIMNPRFSVLEQLSRRSVAISQKLQVHAQATIGKPEDNKNKNAAKNKMAQAFEDADDDLIARPN